MKNSKLSIKLLATTMLIQLLFLSTSCAQKTQKEEDGTQFTKRQTYNKVEYGVRLILKYNKEKEAFIGTAKNISNEMTERTRVEVHLSNGTELGPTKPKDLKPGESFNVYFSTKGEKFKKWSTHAEVGSREHGKRGEGKEGGEGHTSREKGEHGKKGEGREGKGGEGKGGHSEGGEGKKGHTESPGHEGKGGDGSSSSIISINKSFKGVIDGLAVNMSYNTKTNSVHGTIKNVTSKTICFVQTEHHLKKGKSTVGEMKTTKVGDLKPGQTKRTSSSIRERDKKRLTRKGAVDGFVIHLEVFKCGGPGPKGGEGKEGKGEH